MIRHHRQDRNLQRYGHQQSDHQRLLAAASNIPAILPENFHDIARSPKAISYEQDQHNLELMTLHTTSGDLTYLYTYVMVDGAIYFTACNYTVEDIENNQVVTYWTGYPEGAQEYFDAMTADEPIYVTAGDSWGLFRTILMPMTSPTLCKALKTFIKLTADWKLSFLKLTKQTRCNLPFRPLRKPFSNYRI